MVVQNYYYKLNGFQTDGVQINCCKLGKYKRCKIIASMRHSNENPLHENMPI